MIRFLLWASSLGLVLASVPACRTPEPSGSPLLEENPLCAAPIATNEMPGAKIFEVSSKCLFNRSPHNVRIRILSETFEKVLKDGCSGEKSGYGHVIELDLDGIKIPNVGIKVRGNTSRCNPKRQFKLKFDLKKAFSVYQGRFEEKKFDQYDDRSVFGQKGLSLRASANDPTMFRERLGSKIFTQAQKISGGTSLQRGAPVYRVTFAQLYVSYNRTESPEGNFHHLYDGHYYDYKGIYSLTENIDRNFLKARLQKAGEKLNGTFVQADLGKGAFRDGKYQKEGLKLELVKGKKVKSEAQKQQVYAELDKLAKLLGSSPTLGELETALDLDALIAYTAAAILSGHWDSLLTNGNNDFLYWNDATSKWQIFTWDLDNSFGVMHAEYKSHMSSKVTKPANPGFENQLFTAIFKHESARKRLQGTLRYLLDDYAAPSQINSTIDHLAKQIGAMAAAHEAVSQNHVDDVKRFMKVRRERLSPQL